MPDTISNAFPGSCGFQTNPLQTSACLVEGLVYNLQEAEIQGDGLTKNKTCFLGPPCRVCIDDFALTKVLLTCICTKTDAKNDELGKV